MKLDSLLLVRGEEEKEGLLECALRMAQKSGSRITVAGTLENLPPGLQAASILELWNRAALEKKDELEELHSMISEKGIEADARVLFGTPFVEIIREVLKGGHSLVMKTAEESGRVRGAFLGSNDLHLLRKCPCPVLISRHAAGCRFERIMAAIDPAPYSEEKTALNLRILDAAATFARIWGAKLHIVHAWELLSESLLRVRSLISEHELEAYLSEAHIKHKKWLGELIDRASLEDIPHTAHLLKGSPWEIIPAIQKEKKIDLAVMGTVARAGFPGLFIGNTAEKILHKLNSSVLVVKPEGFAAPQFP